MNSESKEWFREWFDTEHYHRLYAHRNEQEAQPFLERLVERLNLPKGSHVLDLACGRGRHARILHALGYRVTGLDLSARNIAYCKVQETEGLQFVQGDMRLLPYQELFDAVLLLFTSFGYFSDVENALVIDKVHKSLKPGGWFVLDFFNAHLLKNLSLQNITKKLSGHLYQIHKFLTPTHICKEILVDYTSRYLEKVRLYYDLDLRNLLQERGFSICYEAGDYHLEPYQRNLSPRYIALSQKQG
ncbi:MAG: class I SAM-dependent methyltransferase [Flavobacteriales bacterium]|nr:class I SAM-dependent methyltransferase [Flavobacteriales bacterium]